MKAAFKKLFYDRYEEAKFGILLHPLFISVLIIKLVCAWFFASDFLVDLFAKFSNQFLASDFQNPYQYFFDKSNFIIFPYPALMLWIISIPGLFLKMFCGADIFSTVSNIHVFVYRIPILLADTIIFCTLIRWLKTRQFKVLLYYWCSPILFYINYLHGQLDAIPMMFLFLSLHFLFKEKFAFSVTILSLAICCKTNILLVIPFYFIYLYRKNISWAKMLLFVIVIMTVFMFINAPFIGSQGFQKLVFGNREQQKVFDLKFSFNENLSIYFVPIMVLFLLVKTFTFRDFNRPIFVMLLGFAFGMITVMIPPMPGWYYWVIPLFIYFFIKQENNHQFEFILLNVMYFLYFLIIKNSDVFEIFQICSSSIASKSNPYMILKGYGYDVDKLVNLVFTLLQSLLLVNCIWIYKIGINLNIKYKIKYQPYLIGVAGDSSAGKSTLSDLIARVFGEKMTLVVRGDDMHKWERGDEHWKLYTHLDPMANRLHADIEQLSRLKKGKTIKRSSYNHDDGKFTTAKDLAPKRVIIHEGLHSFYLEKMGDVLDLKIFLMAEEQLRVHWKVLRDTSDRNTSREKVIEQIHVRERDAHKYIKPQEENSDLTFSMCNKFDISDIGDSKTELDLYLKITVDNHVMIDSLVDRLIDYRDIEIQYSHDRKRQFVEIKGEIKALTIDRIAYDLIPDLYEVQEEISWEDGFNGIIQLFTCYSIFSKEDLL